MEKKTGKRAKIPVVFGTGLVALDVIVTADESSPPKLCTGGTCANVLLALRYLGFEVVPVCRLQNDPAGILIQKEFKLWEVSTKFVSLGDDGNTPIIVQMVRTTPAGTPTHTFSWRCPFCGTRFPGYKPVLATTAEGIASDMQSLQIFFFDRVSRGALVLASQAAKLGALVVFEPSGVGDPSLFQEAWSVAHVVKYSHERLSEIPDGLECSPNQILQVETLGSEGLRYRAKFGKRDVSPWRILKALKAPVLKDTAGAGDWCTAGLLYKLARGGAKSFRLMPLDEMEAGLRFGQALAAWNCGFVGARGGMYQTTVEKCLEQVDRILAGEETLTKKNYSSRKFVDGNHAWCPSCSFTSSQPRTVTANSKPATA
jgi:sugar/nucleoside kinase (ribokinase family)